jgi:hypothetical protein
MLPVDTLQALSIKSKILASYWETLPQFMPSFTTIEKSSMLLNGLICALIGAAACGLIAAKLTYSEIIMSDDSK